MKYLTLITFYLLSIVNSFSQYSTSWIKTNGTSEAEYTYSAIKTNDENILIVGRFQGTIEFGGMEVVPTGAKSFFVQKMGSNGIEQWTKIFESDDNLFMKKVVQDEESNFYFSGFFEGTVDFDPGVGIRNKTATGSPSAFILKLNSNGTFLWVRTMSGIDDISVNGLGVLNGRLMVSGSFTGEADLDPSVNTQTYIATTTGSSSLFVQEYDTNGILHWTNTWSGKSKYINGSSRAQCIDLHLDEDGNVFVVGTYTDSLDLDPGIGENIHVATGGSNGFIIVLNATNDYSWGKVFAGTGISIVNDVTVDYNGDLYLTGFFKDSVDFDLGIGTHKIKSVGQYDIYLLKLNDNGELIWVKTYGDTSFDTGRAVETDSEGNVYLVGEFQKTVDFNESKETTFTGTVYDGFILKLAPNGDYISVNTIEGTGGSYVTNITPASPNQYYAVGRFLDTAYFDNSTSTYKTSEGSTDYFIAKYSDKSTVGLYEWDVENTNLFSVIWNNGSLKVSSLTDLKIQNIGVYTTLGKNIFSEAGVYNTQYEQSVNTTQGIYLVQVGTSNGDQYVYKVLNYK